jgi:type II secretory pathway predicted ATPase ExeA
MTMTTIDKRLARFGLSFHPFTLAVPTAACQVTPAMAHLIGRCDHLIASGGFAVISGDSGTGKSTLLRLLHARLGERTDLVTGVLTRPQAKIADFYRELGALFGVSLAPHNRWAGAQVLRERWQAHWGTSHQRPVLIIDEAQEMQVTVLSELRLLATAELDAVALLSVILAGDARLNELLQARELMPLASRIRIHHRTAAATITELAQLLEHLLTRAGNPSLMTDGLKHSLVEHACGNRRSLVHLADQLLDAALEDPACATIDESLFARVMRAPVTGAGAGAGAGTARARKAL